MRKYLLIPLVIIGVLSGFVLSKGLAALKSDRIISEYLKGNQIRKLQLGAGGVNLTGWLNTDIEPGPNEAYLDATKKFPLADNSISYIFGEHVIEHLPYDDGLAMLRECRRVLAPGGRVRFATPDLRKLMALMDSVPSAYRAGKFKFHEWAPKPDPVVPAFIINTELRSWGHNFVYDEPALTYLLTEAGFDGIRRFDPGVSDDPNLGGIEARHKNLEARPMNDYETMVLEAVKPIQ